MSIESVMLSNQLMLCHPLLLLPSIFSSIRVFSNKLALCIRWTKYWNFSFSISPSNECSGLISFRIDCLISLQSKGLPLLQHHRPKTSVFQCSTFFMVQLSHPYKTTGKTTALTRWIFVGKVISLLFNTLSRFVLEKAMATHPSVLAWRIPGAGSLVGCCLWGYTELDTTEVT